jgi:hypothetical protein
VRGPTARCGSGIARRLYAKAAYWEQYELTRVQDAHDRRKCRDYNGSEPWACENCDCTERLEQKLVTLGEPFLETLRSEVAGRT